MAQRRTAHFIVRMESVPITAFENQVGGHRFDLQKQGMLHQGSTILKQLQDQGRGLEVAESL